jgi:hypothetical protein
MHDTIEFDIKQIIRQENMNVNSYFSLIFKLKNFLVQYMFEIYTRASTK